MKVERRCAGVVLTAATVGLRFFEGRGVCGFGEFFDFGFDRVVVDFWAFDGVFLELYFGE